MASTILPPNSYINVPISGTSIAWSQRGQVVTDRELRTDVECALSEFAGGKLTPGLADVINARVLQVLEGYTQDDRWPAGVASPEVLVTISPDTGSVHVALKWGGPGRSVHFKTAPDFVFDAPDFVFDSVGDPVIVGVLTVPSTRKNAPWFWNK